MAPALSFANFIAYLNQYIMENQKDPLLNAEDKLKAENTMLKFKLGLEHGMQMHEGGDMSPEIENKWLKSVYEFEQQHKDAKPVKVYDHIGRPAFMKCDELSAVELGNERQRIQSIMAENGVELDCICEYDDATIYRFITEELFEHEMDDIRITGMTYHFIYEEFHPNHEHDLRRHTTMFVNSIFGRQWNAEFDGMIFERSVTFSGRQYSRAEMSSIVQAFQNTHSFFHMKAIDVNQVFIDGENLKADVRATLSVSGKRKFGGTVEYAGVCAFQYKRVNDYWSVTGFHIPGFSRTD